MKKNKKKRIDIYKTIYDIDIVVANQYTTLKDLQKKYKYADDGSELDDFITQGYGTTAMVRDKKTNASCCLVRFNKTVERTDIDKLLDTIDTCVHEAMHCLIDIYASVDAQIQYTNPEPVCYEIANISKNILKTILNR